MLSFTVDFDIPKQMMSFVLDAFKVTYSIQNTITFQTVDLLIPRLRIFASQICDFESPLFFGFCALVDCCRKQTFPWAYLTIIIRFRFQTLALFSALLLRFGLIPFFQKLRARI